MNYKISDVYYDFREDKLNYTVIFDENVVINKLSYYDYEDKMELLRIESLDSQFDDIDFESLISVDPDLKEFNSRIRDKKLSKKLYTYYTQYESIKEIKDLLVDINNINKNRINNIQTSLNKFKESL
jgi:hypothetical protein